MPSTQQDKPDHQYQELDNLASQNFGLTESKFESMLEQMKAGNESLFEKVFLAQFEESRQYLIKRYSVNSSRAYDATMDALLKFRKRLLAGKVKYGNMRFLFTRMASQFLSESYNNREIMMEKIEATEEEESNFDGDVLDMLDKAWSHLGRDCATILHHFYYQKIKLKTLATQLNKTEASIRKQKQRCLEKLRLFFLKYYQE